MTTRQENALRVVLAPIQGVEVRGDAGGTGDGSLTIQGYAAVFEQETTLWDGRWYQMDEEIARDAFKDVLGRVANGDELVHLNYVHDMASAVAASDVRADGSLPIGGLELSADEHGLRFFARVDPDDPDAQRMAVKMKRGVVKQASFAFTIASEELVEAKETDDGKSYEKWRITEIGHLYDVCACPQGAYAQTEVGVRSLAAASLLGRASVDLAGLQRRDDEPGVDLAAPPVGESDDQAREHALWQAATRAQIRTTKGGIQ